MLLIPCVGFSWGRRELITGCESANACPERANAFLGKDFAAIDSEIHETDCGNKVLVQNNVIRTELPVIGLGEWPAAHDLPD